MIKHSAERHIACIANAACRSYAPSAVWKIVVLQSQIRYFPVEESNWRAFLEDAVLDLATTVPKLSYGLQTSMFFRISKSHAKNVRPFEANHGSLVYVWRLKPLRLKQCRLHRAFQAVPICRGDLNPLREVKRFLRFPPHHDLHEVACADSVGIVRTIQDKSTRKRLNDIPGGYNLHDSDTDRLPDDELLETSYSRQQ